MFRHEFDSHARANQQRRVFLEASEKLFELYGRDKNDWQLAEVEYLMRVAQHKLILQHDFEGAAGSSGRRFFGCPPRGVDH